MKKLLFLTPQLPYPPISGGVIKSFKLVEFLSSEYQLTLACLLKSTTDENNLVTLEKVVSLDTVVTQSLNIARTPINFIKSCLATIPLTIYRNRSAEFKAKISAIADDYEMILVDHYLMSQYIPANYQGRVVVHQHNAEFVIWSRMAEQTAGLLKKCLLRFEAARIRRFEVAMCRQVDRVLAAPNDQAALAAYGVPIDKFVDTYHLGDEENLTLPALQFSQTGMNILFVGTLSWEANLDGLIWFLSDVWPQIKQACPEARFTIVGKLTEGLSQKLLALAPELNLPGFVDNLETVYQNHRVFVAPLRFGSGIKVKVVNGLYRGMPTVTTSVGAEGLKLTNGEHLCIADDGLAFADSVVSLLNNETLWQQLSEQSRTHMQQHFSWRVVFDNVQRSLLG